MNSLNNKEIDNNLGNNLIKFKSDISTYSDTLYKPSNLYNNITNNITIKYNYKDILNYLINEYNNKIDNYNKEKNYANYHKFILDEYTSIVDIIYNIFYCNRMEYNFNININDEILEKYKKVKSMYDFIKNEHNVINSSHTLRVKKNVNLIFNDVKNISTLLDDNIIEYLSNLNLYNNKSNLSISKHSSNSSIDSLFDI
jgi:hypothetical protein